LRLGKPGTALFATLGLLGAEFVALYAAFMAYGPSAFANLQTVSS
jgi:dihydroorotate dehydrogenase